MVNSAGQNKRPPASEVDFWSMRETRMSKREPLTAPGGMKPSMATTVEPMSAVSVGSGTLGFWRVEGELGKGSDKQSWSAIVKGLDYSTTIPTIRFGNAGREFELGI